MNIDNDSIVKDGCRRSIVFQLNPEYQEKLTNAIRIEINEGRYYNL